MDSLKLRSLTLGCLMIMGGISLSFAMESSVDNYFQWHVGYRTSNTRCSDQRHCSVPFNDQRFQIKSAVISDSGIFDTHAKLELLHDSLDDISLDDGTSAVPVDKLYDTRELYLNTNTDLMLLGIGRQVVTWGVGDLLFINDIFPKDWISFYSGQPMEYLKRGMDMVKLSVFLNWITVDLITADFREDRLPDNRSFIFNDISYGKLPYNVVAPDNFENALRLSGYLDNWDVAFYASESYFRQPAYSSLETTTIAVYPRLKTVGFSISGPLFSGVLNFEAGQYNSADDNEGNKPTIANSSDRALIGFNYQLGQDTMIGAQYYVQIMDSYDKYLGTLPTTLPAEPEYQRIGTLRFTKFYFHNTLTVNIFLLWEHHYQDGLSMASVRYSINDAIWMEFGTHAFYGKGQGQFAQLNKNDIAYTTIKYSF